MTEQAPPTYSQAELSQLQADYEHSYHNIPFKCRLTAFGKELFLKNNYPNMTLETIAGVTYLTGGYNREELAYMTHYLITFGEHITIEYPEQLKASYLQQLQTIMHRYQ
ncbi:WYL domain-containing protein [Loigolactobacillus jiayinensis]|uniref:WYL domain-containing protein n=1 Tax=Loigolactobacillus jiayinensis TaxID=2486016 RepID=A0ABW1RDQ9_9LACO|nr:WYL domain-containing protein [Loigolactobacillus jiayinensis]